MKFFVWNSIRFCWWVKVEAEKHRCAQSFLPITALKILGVLVPQVNIKLFCWIVRWSLISVDVEQCYVRFLGNLILNLWDCGGQEAFMECYFAAQKDNIFKNVEVLIYVFDVQSSELDKVVNRNSLTRDEISFSWLSCCFRIYTTINLVSNRFYNIQITQKSSVLYIKWI